MSTKKVSMPDFAIDKTYMMQLVDVQHRRGATGGEIFKNSIKNSDVEMLSPKLAAASVAIKKGRWQRSGIVGTRRDVKTNGKVLSFRRTERNASIANE